MRWQNHIFVFFTLVLSLIVTNNLEAQTNLQIEEIVVTATKKETTLQDAPLAISVIGVEQIEQLAINDILDLQSSVPSLKINQQQFANQKLIDRIMALRKQVADSKDVADNENPILLQSNSNFFPK